MIKIPYSTSIAKPNDHAFPRNIRTKLLTDKASYVEKGLQVVVARKSEIRVCDSEGDKIERSSFNDNIKDKYCAKYDHHACVMFKQKALEPSKTLKKR
ncbi:unnamed protein product [Sphenostylis stenocarpa]|uniref:Uncharacterized protein n=1 Tax=Sphenostylis stenocarpa TaxID=92480 RepID=A0AA86T6F9_9FABA|nr:unnamed protein product [Sphenostylis stenocarpa]